MELENLYKDVALEIVLMNLPDVQGRLPVSLKEAIIMNDSERGRSRRFPV